MTSDGFVKGERHSLMDRRGCLCAVVVCAIDETRQLADDAMPCVGGRQRHRPSHADLCVD